MLKMIHIFDNVCINTVQNFSNWLQSNIGINNFTLARLLVLFSVLDWLSGESGEFGESQVFSLTIACIEIVFRICLVHFAESLTGRSGKFINPLREGQSLVLLRMVFFLDAIFSVFGVRTIHAISALFRWFFYLIVSCTPLPPGISKLKSWTQRLASSKLTSVRTES